MEKTSRSGWVRPIGRMICVVLAAVSLAGCVIAPVHPWHPRYYY